MFGNNDNKNQLRDATYTKIQGFPKDQKEKTIHELVAEIKDQEKVIEAKQQYNFSFGNKHLQKTEAQSQMPNTSASALSLSSLKDNISPNKERKTRK